MNTTHNTTCRSETMRTLDWKDIGLPKTVTCRKTCTDPIRWDAVATIDYYGQTITGTGDGETKGEALRNAKSSAAYLL